MNPRDPNVQLVERVAAALDELCGELVFVGGCAAGLLCTSLNAPPPRVTYDVDVIAEVAALSDYHALERQFAARGFKRDMSADAPICRWRLGQVEVDLMPTDERILGFSNRWYSAAIAGASEVPLPSGRRIRLISAPAFLATKFEAFATRGRRSAYQPRFRGHHQCARWTPWHRIRGGRRGGRTGRLSGAAL